MVLLDLPNRRYSKYVASLKKYLMTICLFVLIIVTVIAVYFTYTELVSCKKTIVIDGKSYRAHAYDERVRFLIIHYTHTDFESSMRLLTGPNVSAHYVVNDQDPYHVYQLLDEGKRAYHAGVSAWQRYTNLNDMSIGIEIVNAGPRPDGTWTPFVDLQVDAVIQLAQQIVHRYGIQPQYVLGHSDIAPGRKMDPGPLFPWARLHCHGVGAWYDTTEHVENGSQEPVAPLDIKSAQRKFKRYGYAIEETGILDNQTKAVVRAFQMHFRPSNYSGQLDGETVAILEALIRKYENEGQELRAR